MIKKRPATRKKMALADRAELASGRFCPIPTGGPLADSYINRVQRGGYYVGFVAGYRAAQRDAKKGAK